MEFRDHGASASGHVTVAHDGKTYVLGTGIGICRDEKLIAHQLRAAVKVHGIYRLIRGKRHYLLYAAIQRCIDHVLGAVDIGFDRLCRIVFTGRYLF